MLTPFPELDAVLADLTGTAHDILGDTFVGAYVQGSFALGAGDENSDCDFIIATTTLPSGQVEADLRRLHDDIPTRAGFWTKHLEGSYADIARWRPLLTQVIQDRSLGWDPADPPRPGSLEAAHEFAVYAESFARRPHVKAPASGSR